MPVGKRLHDALRVVALLLAALAAGSAAPARPAAVVMNATLDDLAFMAGRWEGHFQGGAVDEIWMPPRGNSMAGSYRFAAEGRAPELVMMLIEHTPDGVFFRFRNFAPDFAELRPDAVVFKLDALTPNRAEFARMGDGAPLRRLIYERVDDAHLDITLEFAPGTRDRTSAVFHLMRADAGADSSLSLNRH
ncbi:MAG: hypothetical protein D6807_04360 [Alphaproteobacteria bacterium]|nr:MAG: hypothetical protein D6807_04360 [Alphaproteobacteria bacterium]